MVDNHVVAVNNNNNNNSSSNHLLLRSSSSGDHPQTQLLSGKVVLEVRELLGEENMLVWQIWYPPPLPLLRLVVLAVVMEGCNALPSPLQLDRLNVMAVAAATTTT